MAKARQLKQNFKKLLDCNPNKNIWVNTDPNEWFSKLVAGKKSTV
jgi:hypothetical protein